MLCAKEKGLAVLVAEGVFELGSKVLFEFSALDDVAALAEEGAFFEPGDILMRITRRHLFVDDSGDDMCIA